MEVDDRTLFIANLDKNVTEDILYELFLQAGPVERVSIPANRNSTRYGFVTYKHECSINYAIELFKGTSLFKKELSIKKRCPKSNGDVNKFVTAEHSGERDEINSFQNQLLSLQLLAQNLNYNSQPMINFTSNALKGTWSSRNRPYDFGKMNNFSRPREVRDRRKDRDYANKKSYQRRNNRHRD